MSIQDTTTGLVVLAVDDEKHGLAELKHYLQQNPLVKLVLTAEDATEALRVIRGTDTAPTQRRPRESQVDAVFLDITMPGLSGMELAHVLAAIGDPPALVFVTGHPEHALEAWEIGALGYVVKPLRRERIDKVLKLVARHRAGPGTVVVGEQPNEDEVIPVELAGTTKLVPRSAVRWVEAQGDYARLHTSEGSHLVRIPLAQLEERWADAGFVRIHRSYLVSLPLVSELRMSSSGYTVVLDNDGEEVELPVSRRHTRELKDRLVRTPKNGWGQS